MHLADGANMFHVKAEALRAGDVLLLRWQRRGIGHTVPVMRVKSVPEDRLEVAVATGSMPRRYPKWEEGGRAARYFKKSDAGGPGMNGDEEEYATLGGGLRRWRIARKTGDRYINTFASEDQDLWINSRDHAAVAHRIEKFETLLRELTPTQKRDLAVQLIEDARSHLRAHPSSCNARTRREEAFAQLYEVNQEHFWMDREQTDAKYRTLEDYVYGRLEYSKSRTCCWNSTTEDMNAIIMDHARDWIMDTDAEMCREPMVFMARDIARRDDGYALYRQYADETDRGEDWVAWSADEACPQEDAGETDVVIVEEASPWCELKDISVIPATCGDTGTAVTDATAITQGTTSDLRICRAETDLWVYNGSGRTTIKITSEPGMGEFDFYITDTANVFLGAGTSAEVDEKLTIDLGMMSIDIVIHVFMPDAMGERGYGLTIEPAPTAASDNGEDDSSDGPPQ